MGFGGVGWPRVSMIRGCICWPGCERREWGSLIGVCLDVVGVGDLSSACVGRESAARGRDGPVFLAREWMFWVDGTLKGTGARLTVSWYRVGVARVETEGGRLAECGSRVADPLLKRGR